MNESIESANGYGDANNKNVECKSETTVSSMEARLAELEKFAREASKEIKELKSETERANAEAQYAIGTVYEMRDAIHFPPMKGIDK